MTRYVLGIDIGGTKSHALIADETGRAVGFGQTGPGSYEFVGWEGLQSALHAVTNAALAAVGLEQDQISGAGFGIAGYDWPGERPGHLEAIASLGLRCPTALVNDTIIGLIAGAPEGWGVGVVAGTGSNAWGRDREGCEGHTTGGGPLYAEYAGGGDIVARAIQTIALAWTRRGPETALTDAFVDYLDATDVEDLLEGIFMGRYAPDAAAAPLIFQVAAAGDPVALDIIRWAGRELGSLAIGVIRQLGIEHENVAVVQIGSLYRGSPLLSEEMLVAIRQVAPGAHLVRLATPPVVGATLLAMEQAGIEVPPVRQRLVETTAELMEASAL